MPSGAQVGTPAVRTRVLVAGAVLLLVAAMFASFAPTPLYPRYDARWDIGPLGVAVAFAGYPVGVIVVVLGVGGLSDRVGRQRAMLVATGLVLAGLLLSSAVGSLAELTAARLVQGAGTGLAGSTAAAALAEHHPRGPAAGAGWHALGSTIGMGLGPVTAGWLSTHTAHPLVVPYLAVAALAVVPGVLLVVAGADPAPVPGQRLLQSVRVPRVMRSPFLVASAGLLAINGCNGLFGAFSSRIAAAGLHADSAVTTGRLMGVLIAALGVGQLSSTRLDPWTGCRLGLATVVAGLATSAAGVATGGAALTWAGCVVVGLGGGVAFLGSTRLIATSAPPERRAECYGAWMVVGFVAMAAAALLSGSVLHGADVAVVLGWATGLAALTALVALGVRRTDGGATP
jgi:MFS family permease